MSVILLSRDASKSKTYVSWRFPLGKGAEKKCGKSMVFYQTPLGPPPPFGLFCGKKLTPIFLLENASVIAETNFMFGPMFKTNLLAPQSGAHTIAPHRDPKPNPIQSIPLIALKQERPMM